VIQRPEDLENFAVHLRVFGKVQGVGFRAWAKEQADKKGLRGWARNRSDGSVEVVFVGHAHTLDGMVTLCRKGPAGAEVSRVARIPGEYRPDETEVPPGFQLFPDV
jgi:acylphosphatase